MNRVSTRRSPKENSFHRRVPTGKTQASGSEPSMALPGGSDIQRRLAAPSVQSGYCRREGEVARIDLKGSEIRIEPGLLQGRRRLAGGRLRNRVEAREQRDDEDQGGGG